MMKLRLKYFFNFDFEKIKFILSSKNSNIRVLFETFNDIPYISFYLFKKRVYRKRFKLKKRKRLGINLFRIVNTTDMRAEVSYGLDNPCATGLLYAVLSALSNVKQFPDFLPQHNFITVNGSLSVYVWTTIKNYMNYKRKIEG